MKILQISTGYDIDFNGGITNYVRNFSDTLVNSDHEVVVLYSQDSGIGKTHAYKTIGIRPKLRPFHKSGVLYNEDIFEIEKIVESVKPDIIHVHMMIDLPIGVLEMFRKHSKLIISLHDYSHICGRIVLIKPSTGDNCINSNENRDCNLCIESYESINNKYLRALIKFQKTLFSKGEISPSSGHHERFIKGKNIFMAADAIVAVSTRVKEIYQNNGYLNKNFIVNHIGNYTAEENFRDLFKNRKKIAFGDSIKFGFIGNLNKIKGSELFLELAESVSHEFHIYGGIEKEIEAIINTKKNIFYHGKYKHEELPNILLNVDFGLVLPIWEDNAPQVVFEFLNAGIPILGTKMGGLPDFINETNGKIFENNKEGLDEAKKFINSNEVYNLYNLVVNRIEGTKKAKQHTEEMVELYNQVLNSN